MASIYNFFSKPYEVNRNKDYDPGEDKTKIIEYRGRQIQELPTDILNQILGFTDIATVGKICTVSKFWRDLMISNRQSCYPWKYLLEREENPGDREGEISHHLDFSKREEDEISIEIQEDEFEQLDRQLQMKLAAGQAIQVEKNGILCKRKIALQITAGFLSAIFIFGGSVFFMDRYLFKNENYGGNFIIVFLSMLTSFGVCFGPFIYMNFKCAILKDKSEAAWYQYAQLRKNDPIKVYERIFETQVLMKNAVKASNENESPYYLKLKKKKQLDFYRKLVKLDWNLENHS